VTLAYVWHDSFICVTWLIHTCDMTRSYVWHDSFIYVTWLIHMCDMTHSYVWHDSFICVTWLIHMCNMTHSYVLHDSFICVPRLIYACDMTHLYVWHDSFICVTWLIHIRHSSYSSVTYKGGSSTSKRVLPCSTPSICCSSTLSPSLALSAKQACANSCVFVTFLIRATTHSHVTPLTCMCDCTHLWHDSFACDTINLLLLDAIPLFGALRKAGTRELISMCDMTHSWQDLFNRVTWLIRVCDVTHSCVWLDSFVTRLFHMWHHHSAAPRQYHLFWRVVWRVVSHMSHVTHESYYTYEWVMSHTWRSLNNITSFWRVVSHMSHVTHESCRTNEWVMTHTWRSLDSISSFSRAPHARRTLMSVCVPWLIHMCDMTRRHECGLMSMNADSCKVMSMCVDSLISISDSCLCVCPCLCVCHDSFTCLCVCHDSFTCESLVKTWVSFVTRLCAKSFTLLSRPFHSWHDASVLTCLNKRLIQSLVTNSWHDSCVLTWQDKRLIHELLSRYGSYVTRTLVTYLSRTLVMTSTKTCQDMARMWHDSYSTWVVSLTCDTTRT